MADREGFIGLHTKINNWETVLEEKQNTRWLGIKW